MEVFGVISCNSSRINSCRELVWRAIPCFLSAIAQVEITLCVPLRWLAGGRGWQTDWQRVGLLVMTTSHL